MTFPLNSTISGSLCANIAQIPKLAREERHLICVFEAIAELAQLTHWCPGSQEEIDLCARRLNVNRLPTPDQKEAHAAFCQLHRLATQLYASLGAPFSAKLSQADLTGALARGPRQLPQMGTLLLSVRKLISVTGLTCPHWDVWSKFIERHYARGWSKEDFRSLVDFHGIARLLVIKNNSLSDKIVARQLIADEWVSSVEQLRFVIANHNPQLLAFAIERTLAAKCARPDKLYTGMCLCREFLIHKRFLEDFLESGLKLIAKLLCELGDAHLIVQLHPRETEDRLQLIRDYQRASDEYHNVQRSILEQLYAKDSIDQSLLNKTRELKGEMAGLCATWKRPRIGQGELLFDGSQNIAEPWGCFAMIEISQFAQIAASIYKNVPFELSHILSLCFTDADQLPLVKLFPPYGITTLFHDICEVSPTPLSRGGAVNIFTQLNRIYHFFTSSRNFCGQLERAISHRLGSWNGQFDAPGFSAQSEHFAQRRSALQALLTPNVVDVEIAAELEMAFSPKTARSQKGTLPCSVLDWGLSPPLDTNFTFGDNPGDFRYRRPPAAHPSSELHKGEPTRPQKSALEHGGAPHIFTRFPHADAYYRRGRLATCKDRQISCRFMIGELQQGIHAHRGMLIWAFSEGELCFLRDWIPVGESCQQMSRAIKESLSTIEGLSPPRDDNAQEVWRWPQGYKGFAHVDELSGTVKLSAPQFPEWGVLTLFFSDPWEREFAALTRPEPILSAQHESLVRVLEQITGKVAKLKIESV